MDQRRTSTFEITADTAVKVTCHFTPHSLGVIDAGYNAKRASETRSVQANNIPHGPSSTTLSCPAAKIGPD